MRISKKILACVLAALMAIAMMPFTAFAATINVNSADSLEAAAASANAGDTIKLTGNVDFTTKYVRYDFHKINLAGLTLDLNGYEITTYNGAVVYVGDDFTITNGTMTCVNYPGYNVQPNNAYAVNIEPVNDDNLDDKSTGVVLDSLILNGGVNAWCSEVTCRNLNVNGTTYYAVWADEDQTKVTIESGTYASTSTTAHAVIASAVDEHDKTKPLGSIDVYGGDFTVEDGQALVLGNGDRDVNIHGGTFVNDNNEPIEVPAKYLAEGCTQVDGTVTQTSVAKIGSTLYATLEEAAEAATAGQTITLIADVDLTAYARNAAHKINLSGTVLDLNGHTISNKNKGVVFVGDNFTVKNGNMVCVNDPSFTKYKPDNSYGIMIWPEDGDDVHDTVADPSENVVLENLNVTGGINCFGSNVTIKGENTNVAGTAFYAVWANAYTTIDIEDGTFTTTANETTSTIGAGVETGKGAINVKGGNFTVASGKVLVHDNSSKDRVVISGGFYHNANGSVYEVLPANLAADHTQDTTSGEVIPAAVDTMSITVEDDIDLNIYLDDSDASETYNRIKTIKYTYNITPDLEEENMETFTVPATRDANDKVVLKIELAPAQIRDDITVVAITEAGETVRNFTTSIADYCNTIINGNYPANLKDLAKSTLDYGKGTSSYFGYNTTAYSSYSIQLDDPTAEITALAQAAEANTIDTDKFTITGVSYRATSKPEIRFYIDPTTISEDLLAGYNETIVSTIGTAYFAKHDDDYLLIVKDIDIVDFNKQFVVTVKDSHDELYDWDVVHFTPITWVYAALKSTDTPLKSLAKTIGNYYLKSANYFGV